MTAVTITITKSPTCGHVTIRAYVAGSLVRTMVTTLTDLKAFAGNIDNEVMLISQIKKIVGENPNATLNQLKVKIEAETYYV